MKNFEFHSPTKIFFGRETQNRSVKLLEAMDLKGSTSLW